MVSRPGGVARVDYSWSMDWSAQTRFSDPGRFSTLLDAILPEPEAVSGIARNLVAHYAAERDALPAATRGDINLRWVEAQLAVDQDRHHAPLAAPRRLGERLQGCCRDHSLLSMAMLRHHGRPARSRVGFAGYFSPDHWHDHVVVEVHDGDRWRRFDPEMTHIDKIYLDMPDGVDDPWISAARMWAEIRAGRIDPASVGVFPGSPVGGVWFAQCYVLLELAHRFGDETLLWDGFGEMADPSGPTDEQVALADEIASLLLEVDDHPDPRLEEALEERYRSDPRLHPAARIGTFTPDGELFVVNLITREVNPA